MSTENMSFLTRRGEPQGATRREPTNNVKRFKHRKELFRRSWISDDNRVFELSMETAGRKIGGAPLPRFTYIHANTRLAVVLDTPCTTGTPPLHAMLSTPMTSESSISLDKTPENSSNRFLEVTVQSSGPFAFHCMTRPLCSACTISPG